MSNIAAMPERKRTQIAFPASPARGRGGGLWVTLTSRQPAAVRHFGVDDCPACPKCQSTMFLTRRTPHAHYGNEYELQTFRCRACRHETERSADRGGLPHQSDVLAPAH